MGDLSALESERASSAGGTAADCGRAESVNPSRIDIVKMTLVLTWFNMMIILMQQTFSGKRRWL